MITGSTLYCFSIINQLSGAGWSLLLVKTTLPGKQTPVWSERGLDVMWGAFLIGGIAALWSWCVIVMHKCWWPQRRRRTRSPVNCSTFADSVGGGGGQGHGHGHICQIWKLDELAWFSWEDIDLRGFVQGGLGGLDPQKKANGKTGRDLVHSHLPRCHWRPWGNQLDRGRPPRALVKSYEYFWIVIAQRIRRRWNVICCIFFLLVLYLSELAGESLEPKIWIWTGFNWQIWVYGLF